MNRLGVMGRTSPSGPAATIPIRPRNDITRRVSPDLRNAPIDAEPADAFEDNAQHVDVNILSSLAARAIKFAGRRRHRRNGDLRSSTAHDRRRQQGDVIDAGGSTADRTANPEVVISLRVFRSGLAISIWLGQSFHWPLLLHQASLALRNLGQNRVSLRDGRPRWRSSADALPWTVQQASP